MSSEWPEVSVGQVSTLVTKGTTPTTVGHAFQEDGVRFVKVETLSEDGRFLNNKFAHISEAAHQALLRSQLQIDDVLFTIAGTIGRTGIVKADHLPANTNQAVAIVRPDRAKVEPRFLRYVLGNRAFTRNAQSKTVQSVQANFSLGELRQAKFPLPSLKTQREVLAVLAPIDDRITLLRETNATLEAIAQALFKSWFVDFDPVRAKMEGRAPEGMDEATAALFPDAFEETELGLVPRGWQVGQVCDLGEVVCGKTPPTSVPENYGGEVPFITIPDMHNLLVVTSTVRMLSKIGADSQAKKYLPPGSICVSCIATPGLVVRVTTTAQTNQQINTVIPSEKRGNAFSLFLLRRIGQAVRSGGSGGSVFHNLSKSGFEKLPVLLPTPDVTCHFNKIAESLIRGIIENQEQAQTLSTLRDTLLPRLISGQLRLPAVRQLAEEAC